MRPLILSLALLSAPALAGDFTAKNAAGDSVRLTHAACPDNVLKVIPEAHRESFRKAVAVVGWLQYSACYTVRTDAMVLVIYDDAEMGLIPVGMFRQEPDA